MPSTIALASDHAGFELKEALKRELAHQQHQLQDYGTTSAASCDYPDFAHAVGRALARREANLAILVCGTGVGMAIAANRHPSVRAVVCSEPLSARLARQHNDANVLCLGARVIGPGTAMDIVNSFLSSEFEGGRHASRIAKINAI